VLLPLRKTVVTKSFLKLNKEINGIVTIAQLKKEFKAAKHPLVAKKIFTEEQAKQEFNDLLDMYCQYHKISDGKLIIDDFCFIFSLYSSCINSDEEFQNLMNSVWSLPEKENESPPFYQVSSSKPQPKTPEKPQEVKKKQEEEKKKSPYQVEKGLSPPRQYYGYIIERIKRKLAVRGPRGFLGILRQMKVWY